MKVGTGLRARTALIAALAACAALATGTSTATAAATATASCGGQRVEQPFLRFLDPLQYVAVPGGNFEGTHGWKLSGGAKVVSGNEPFFVAGSTHKSSLYLPRGASATSPALCAGILHPTLRFFAKGGSLTAPLRIDATVSDPVLGLVKTIPLVHPLMPAWLPSLPLPLLVNLGGALDLDDADPTTRISFRFSNPSALLAAPWTIDDVYVDPWVIR